MLGGSATTKKISRQGAKTAKKNKKIKPLRSWRLCYTELAQMVILSYKMVYIHQEFTHDQST